MVGCLCGLTGGRSTKLRKYLREQATGKKSKVVKPEPMQAEKEFSEDFWALNAHLQNSASGSKQASSKQASSKQGQPKKQVTWGSGRGLYDPSRPFENPRPCAPVPILPNSRARMSGPDLHRPLTSSSCYSNSGSLR
jgi:hypothetical protein